MKSLLIKKVMMTGMFALMCSHAVADVGNDRFNQSTYPKITFDANLNVAKTEISNTKDAESTTLSGRLDYKDQLDDEYQTHVVLKALKSTSKDSGSDLERYLVALKGIKNFSDDNVFTNNAFAYAKLQTEFDTSTKYRYQVAPTLGYGKYLMNDNVQQLVAELGVGGQYLKYKGDNKLELLLTAELDYHLAINQIVSVEQNLGLEYGSEVRTLRSKTALVSKLVDHVYAQLSYQIKSNDTDKFDVKDNLLSFGVRLQY